MQEILKRKKLIYTIIILVAAFAVYSFFFGGSGKTEVVTVEKPVLSDESIKGRNLLKILLSLNDIRLDEEIFTSQLFTSLQDFGISLPPISVVGRENPFAPLGAVESPAVAPRVATTTPRR